MFVKKRAEACRDIIEEMIKVEAPKREIYVKLNIQPATLERYLKELNIIYAGQQNKKGQKKGPNDYRPASYYIEHNLPVPGNFLLKKLVRDGVKPYACERCGITEWLGSPEYLVLELNHKDSNHYNNALDNLEILCPNCHAIYTRQNNKNRKKNKQAAVME